MNLEASVDTVKFIEVLHVPPHLHAIGNKEHNLVAKAGHPLTHLHHVHTAGDARRDR
jgi:hypothetical protein